MVRLTADQKESRNSRVKLAVHEWRTYGAQKYSSQIECAKAHGINQSTLNRRLREVNVSHEEARQRIRSRRSPATETIAALSAGYVPPNMPMAVYTTVKQFDYKTAATDPRQTPNIATVNPVFIIYDKAFEEVIGTSPSLSLIDARPDKFAHEAGVYIRKTDTSPPTTSPESPSKSTPSAAMTEESSSTPTQKPKTPTAAAATKTRSSSVPKATTRTLQPWSS
jgi:hypothetical protein